MNRLLEASQRTRAQMTHRLYHLPVVILMPHSACNCRCVMCDIWKANSDKRELPAAELSRHLDAFRRFNVHGVVLSGGEALMHSNLWALCQQLKTLPVKITLLSTGLLLRRHAEPVGRWCDEVIVSLDGSRDVHNRIRNVPDAYEKLADGIQALRTIAPAVRITGRCVLQKMNFFDLPNIVRAAQEIMLDQISFLAADVFSTAFNRALPWNSGRVAEISLSEEETKKFSSLVEEVITEFAEAFQNGFIAENPDKLRRLPRYFAALLGKDDFPTPRCNAPWVSTVIEADGTVRPCFFHPAFGNIFGNSLDAILNADHAVTFRKSLDVQTNSVCRKCTCSLYLKPWRH